MMMISKIIFQVIYLKVFQTITKIKKKTPNTHIFRKK